jgi:hypothetical protein
VAAGVVVQAIYGLVNLEALLTVQAAHRLHVLVLARLNTRLCQLVAAAPAARLEPVIQMLHVVLYQLPAAPAHVVLGILGHSTLELGNSGRGRPGFQFYGHKFLVHLDEMEVVV